MALLPKRSPGHDRRNVPEINHRAFVDLDLIDEVFSIGFIWGRADADQRLAFAGFRKSSILGVQLRQHGPIVGDLRFMILDSRFAFVHRIGSHTV
jgi:hypothetical protein